MSDVYLGIDIGTTRVKAGVVTDDAHLLHVEATPTPWHQTDEGPIVDVVELGDTALAVATRSGAWAREQGHRVVGIGTTGMAETGALLDPDGRPLAPGFAWHHTLGDAEAVQNALGRERFASVTGHGCDLAPSLIKLDYLRHRGHTFDGHQTWLNIPEYVTYRLTGVRACEFSLSGRTGLFDLTHRDWWDDALAFLGADRSLLPGRPVAAGTPVGTVDAAHSTELAGAVVTTAGHDHPVAAFGVGVHEPGTLALSLGTSEAHVRIVEPTLDADAIGRVVELGATADWHPLGDRWYVLSTLPTDITLERLGRLLGCRSTAERAALSEAALASDAVGTARLADVALDRLSLVDLTDADTPTTVWRMAASTLLERSGQHIDQMSDIVGRPTSTVMFGGWTHDPLVRTLRTAMGQRLIEGAPLEPGIVGAALLAQRASTNR